MKNATEPAFRGVFFSHEPRAAAMVRAGGVLTANASLAASRYATCWCDWPPSGERHFVNSASHFWRTARRLFSFTWP